MSNFQVITNFYNNNKYILSIIKTVSLRNDKNKKYSANLEESSVRKEGRKGRKKKEKETHRGGQDGKINSTYRELADVDGGESGRI